MKTMAATLGRDCLLRIDPNGRWKVETAVRIGRGLKGLPMEYYEDPVRGQAGMAEVRKATGLPMSTNMCVTRFTDLAEALQTHPIDVLLGDLHYFGGFAGNLALGPVCDAAGWTMSQHSNNHAGVTMAAMIHLGAVVPQLTMASDTHYPWLVEGTDIIDGPKLAIEGGRMAIPKGPGLGVTLDRDKVARATRRTSRAACAAGRRPLDAQARAGLERRVVVSATCGASLAESAAGKGRVNRPAPPPAGAVPGRRTARAWHLPPGRARAHLSKSPRVTIPTSRLGSSGATTGSRLMPVRAVRSAASRHDSVGRAVTGGGPIRS